MEEHQHLLLLGGAVGSARACFSLPKKEHDVETAQILFRHVVNAHLEALAHVRAVPEGVAAEVESPPVTTIVFIERPQIV